MTLPTASYAFFYLYLKAKKKKRNATSNQSFEIVVFLDCLSLLQKRARDYNVLHTHVCTSALRCVHNAQSFFARTLSGRGCGKDVVTIFWTWGRETVGGGREVNSYFTFARKWLHVISTFRIVIIAGCQGKLWSIFRNFRKSRAIPSSVKQTECPLVRKIGKWVIRNWT